MSRDVLLGNTRRSWSRDLPPSDSGSAGQKVALGGMALGTLAGLLFITSPWWLPLKKPARVHRPDMGATTRRHFMYRNKAGQIVLRTF
jgi:hypothetical protein